MGWGWAIPHIFMQTDTLTHTTVTGEEVTIIIIIIIIINVAIGVTYIVLDVHIGPVADEQLHGLQVIIDTGHMQRRAANLNHARYQTEAGRE